MGFVTLPLIIAVVVAVADAYYGGLHYITERYPMKWSNE